jgi:hypothetical protein
MPDWLNTLLNLPISDWTALGSFLAAGGVVSVLTQFVKHFRAPKWLNHPTAMARFVISFFSFLTAAANYILSTPSKSLSLILAHFAVILTAAHFWYWLSVSPAYKWLISLLDDAAKWRASTAPQSAAATVGVQPTEQFPD